MKIPTTSLFARLLIYFIVILIVPTISLTAYNAIIREDRLRDDLGHQAALLLDSDRENIQTVMDQYRHKAYILSSSDEVITALSNRDGEKQSLYSTLFETMRGDTYLADAHILSKDGSVRISTSIFPERYDIRVHSNDWEEGNILNEIANTGKNSRASIISLGQAKISERGYRVIFSILRCVIDERGQVLGYVIIDVYSEAVVPHLRGSELFADEILVDLENYLGYSLMHPDHMGPMDRFPDINNRNMVVSRADFNSFRLISITNPEPFRNTGNSIFKALTFTLLLGFLISVFFALLFSRSISKRVSNMIVTMKRIEDGELDKALESRTGIAEFDELAGSFNMMVSRISELIEARAEEESKVREAERKALESQLNPHFIFNTLSTVKALARLSGEDKIYTISVELGRLLRSSLRNDSPECPIRESIKLCEAWLKIQKIRFEDTLDYRIDVDEEALDMVTPKLIIQPLVENAVIHGLEESSSQGLVSIDIHIVGDRLMITVTDDGKGLENPEMFKDISKLENSGHVGIYNIYRRLYLRYASSFDFTIENGLNRGTVSRISIPVERKEKADE